MEDVSKRGYCDAVGQEGLFKKAGRGNDGVSGAELPSDDKRKGWIDLNRSETSTLIFPVDFVTEYQSELDFS